MGQLQQNKYNCGSTKCFQIASMFMKTIANPYCLDGIVLYKEVWVFSGVLLKFGLTLKNISFFFKKYLSFERFCLVFPPFGGYYLMEVFQFDIQQ